MDVLPALEKSIISAEQLKIDGIPSASIAILDNGQISSHVITTGRENTETVYQACSISKAITALAVAKLIDGGHLSYETKAVNHLSHSTIDCLVDDKTAHLMQHVTVGMLISHTSDLSQGGFAGYTGDMPSIQDVFAGRSPGNTPKMFFMTYPGAQFSYSGGGTTVLQLILEDVMKMSFPEIMLKTVLQPLGMSRSWFGNSPEGEQNFASAHWTASGLWTTPTDLLKAVIAIQDSLLGDSGFLKRETATKMLTRVDGPSEKDGMAYGWAVDDRAFAHAGVNWPGYNTYVFGFRPTEGGSTARSGIAIMTNSSLGHDFAIREIMSALFYFKGWPRYGYLPCLFGSDDFVPYAAPLDASVDDRWKDWIGEWENGWQILDDDGPKVQFQSMDAMRFRPAAAPVDPEQIFLVIDGLKVGLRLAWEDGERMVELLQVKKKVFKRRG